MSKVKPTRPLPKALARRLRLGQARITVTVETTHGPKLTFSHVVSKGGWSIDLGTNPYSIELTTKGKTKYIRETR